MTDVAHEAHVLAVEANVKIDSHEKTCGERYSMIVKIALFQLMGLFAVVGALLADKFIP